MKMTDGERRIYAIAELLALDALLKDDQARVLSTWVLSRLLHGIAQEDIDDAMSLVESRKELAALQVWMDQSRRKAVNTKERSDGQGNDCEPRGEATEQATEALNGRWGER